MKGAMQPHSREEAPRRERMQTSEEVATMLRLKALGKASSGSHPHVRSQ